MTTNPSQIASDSEVPDAMAEADFFQSVPPGQAKIVKLTTFKFTGYESVSGVWAPCELFLYCTSEGCSGMRYFRAMDTYAISRDGTKYHFPAFKCRNCDRMVKRFAIRIVHSTKGGTVEMFKFGENPQFGPPTPNKLLSLMGAERGLFLKGRVCENQGLGIAAFAYYRRVVEAQKGRIIDEIRKVAEKLGTFPELVSDLRAAKAETRFTEALNRVKHGLPPILLINGHNPLSLLHGALSEGLHATTDEECLMLATSIRVVLAELVERMDTAVKDDAGLKSAVQRLLDAAGKQKSV